MPASSRSDRVRRAIGFALGIAAFVALALAPSALHQVEGYGARPALMAGIAALMAIWWFTEALPIWWTACVPLVMYPMLGIHGEGPTGDAVEAAEPFIDAYIFLFLGGMAIGAAMEQWNLHRRIALHIMRAIGAHPRRLLLGMLVATAAISMWISNTATAVMMLPIAMALVAQLERAEGGRRLAFFGTALMLSIAYAANVGGIATKIGTPTNSIFAGFLSEKLGYEIGFLQYMGIGLPFVALFIPLLWVVLWQHGRRDGVTAVQGREVLDRAIAELGPLSKGERIVAAVFVTAALLWIAGDLVRGWIAPIVPEFWEGFRFKSKHYEAWVAMGSAGILIAARALSWAAFRRIPWPTLLLLGGSFALASGIDGSGLSMWMTRQLGGLQSLSPFLQLLAVSLSTVFLSAVASNTATVNVMLNVLPTSLPLYAATTLASSCDFALPAGTPPNAIVFGSGYVRLPTMMRIGLLLDVIAGVTIAAYVYLYAARLL